MLSNECGTFLSKFLPQPVFGGGPQGGEAKSGGGMDSVGNFSGGFGQNAVSGSARDGTGSRDGYGYGAAGAVGKGGAARGSGLTSVSGYSPPAVRTTTPAPVRAAVPVRATVPAVAAPAPVAATVSPAAAVTAMNAAAYGPAAMGSAPMSQTQVDSMMESRSLASPNRAASIAASQADAPSNFGSAVDTMGRSLGDMNAALGNSRGVRDVADRMGPMDAPGTSSSSGFGGGGRDRAGDGFGPGGQGGVASPQGYGGRSTGSPPASGGAADGPSAIGVNAARGVGSPSARGQALSFGGFNDPFGDPFGGTQYSGPKGFVGPADVARSQANLAGMSYGSQQALRAASDITQGFGDNGLVDSLGRAVSSGFDSINDALGLGTKQTLADQPLSTNVQDVRDPFSSLVQSTQPMPGPSRPAGLLEDLATAVKSNTAAKSDFGVQTPTSAQKGNLGGLFAGSMAMNSVATQDQTPADGYDIDRTAIDPAAVDAINSGWGGPVADIGMTPTGYSTRAANAQMATQAVRDALAGVDLSPGAATAKAVREASPGPDTTGLPDSVHNASPVGRANIAPAANIVASRAPDIPAPDMQFPGVQNTAAMEDAFVGQVATPRSTPSGFSQANLALGMSPSNVISGFQDPSTNATMATGALGPANRALSAGNFSNAALNSVTQADIARQGFNNQVALAREDMAARQAALASAYGGWADERPETVPESVAAEPPAEDPPALLDPYHEQIVEFVKKFNTPLLEQIFPGIEKLQENTRLQREQAAYYGDQRAKQKDPWANWGGGLLSGASGGGGRTPTNPDGQTPAGPNDWWHRWRNAYGRYGLLGPIPYPQEYFA